MTPLSFVPWSHRAVPASPAAGDGHAGDDLLLERGEGRPHPDRGVGSGGQGEHGLVVREERDGALPVVRAHATGSHPTEGKAGDGEVREGDVEAERAGRGVAHEALTHLVGAREDVERQWLVTPVDDVDRRVEPVDGDEGQDGTEDLLTHDELTRVVRVVDLDESRLEVARGH